MHLKTNNNISTKQQHDMHTNTTCTCIRTKQEHATDQTTQIHANEKRTTHYYENNKKNTCRRNHALACTRHHACMHTTTQLTCIRHERVYICDNIVDLRMYSTLTCTRNNTWHEYDTNIHTRNTTRSTDTRTHKLTCQKKKKKNTHTHTHTPAYIRHTTSHIDENTTCHVHPRTANMYTNTNDACVRTRWLVYIRNTQLICVSQYSYCVSDITVCQHTQQHTVSTVYDKCSWHAGENTNPTY